MNPIERLDTAVDLDLAKKAFLFLSAASIFIMPLDALCIYLQQTKPTRLNPVSQTLPQKSEPLESYLTHFERSALFGNASSSLGAPALRASLGELTKDYRLQGVILGAEPEAIIQNARTQKTIFVKKGGLLDELTVKEIKEGSIVLAYLGEEIRLEIQ